jgi:hypothetical protein
MPIGVTTGIVAKAEHSNSTGLPGMPETLHAAPTAAKSFGPKPAASVLVAREFGRKYCGFAATARGVRAAVDEGRRPRPRFFGPVAAFEPLVSR